MALLEAHGLSVAFGGSMAVNQVALEVDAGRLVGLIGPNGAGKTTTVDALTGFVDAVGTIRFRGHELLRRSAFGYRAVAPSRRAHLGLSRTWQGADLFVDLPVLDNLRVANERAPIEDLVGILESLGLGELKDSPTSSLSHGQRKLVGVARALAARPQLVCMDEPAAGLDTTESVALGQRIRAVADQGTAVLLIDHDMGLVLGICDYVYVLDFGRVIAQGTPAEVRVDQRVLDAYLGTRHHAAAAPAPPVGAPSTEGHG